MRSGPQAGPGELRRAMGERLALRVAYEGTKYLGFQRQRAGPTIQRALEEALGRLAGERVKVCGAGRTDAGVHAWEQVIHCTADITVACDRLPLAVNSLLPPDVVVTGAALVPPDFHARYSARGKVYRYLLWQRGFPSPFLRRFAWHCRWRLDVDAMREAARHLLGTHDFRHFSASGGSARTTVRTLRTLAVDVAPDGSLLAFTLEADGFLYKMARRLVGTLVEVGRGRLQPGEVAEILGGEAGLRAGPPAPAHGLCLMRVIYDPPVRFLPEGGVGLPLPFAGWQGVAHPL